MLLSFDSLNQVFNIDMKGAMTHPATLGEDSSGNITRINNAFDKIPQRLYSVEAQLQTLTAQMENARLELEKPFAFEQELTEKSTRLAELDSLLSMDASDAASETQPEKDKDAPAAKRRSVLEQLRAPVKPVEHGSIPTRKQSREGAL
jgi:conjugal transfer/entry exclusion protein